MPANDDNVRGRLISRDERTYDEDAPDEYASDVLAPPWADDMMREAAIGLGDDACGDKRRGLWMIRTLGCSDDRRLICDIRGCARPIR